MGVFIWLSECSLGLGVHKDSFTDRQTSELHPARQFAHMAQVVSDCARIHGDIMCRASTQKSGSWFCRKLVIPCAFQSGATQTEGPHSDSLLHSPSGSHAPTQLLIQGLHPETGHVPGYLHVQL